MGTKILRVTFRDGTRMYGAYSTVVDRAYAEIAMCSDDNNPTDGDLAVPACQRSDRTGMNKVSVNSYHKPLGYGIARAYR